jgi:hypothetical protein
MKTYKGRRERHLVEVTADDRPLDPRLDLCSHSPTGFEWGYGGSGPAQLALALLADHTGDDEEAATLHQDFKRLVVARLPFRGWELTGPQMDSWLEILKSRSTVEQ